MERNLGCFHNLAIFWNCTCSLKTIFGWKQKEENNNISRKLSRLYILALVTLLSADANSAILFSLTKVEVRTFLLLHFPRWLCLAHGQLGMFLPRVKTLVVCDFCLSIFKNGQPYLISTIFFVTKFSLKEIQLSVNCYVSTLNFHWSKYWKHYRL